MRLSLPCALVGGLVLAACAQGVSSSSPAQDDDATGGSAQQSSSSSGEGGAIGGQGGITGSGGAGGAGGEAVGPGGGGASSVSSSGTGGSGGGPRAPLAGELVICEFMPNPNAVADSLGEYIELANVAADPLLLDGCRFYDLNTTPDEAYFNAGTVVPPGARVVAAKSANSAQNGGIANVVLAFGNPFTLANSDDEIILECGGVLIDQVNYGAGWPYGVGIAAQLGPSQLSAQANDVAGNWCAATSSYGLGDLGSPGSASAACP